MSAPPIRNPTWIMTNSDGRSFRFARTRCSPRVSPPLRRRRWFDLCANASNGRLTRSRSVAGRTPAEAATTFLSSSPSWTLGGRASAMHVMRTPMAASAEKRTMFDISAGRSRHWERLEDRGRQCLAALGEMVHVHRAIPGRSVETPDVAFFVYACLAKLEQLMCLRLAVREPSHFANADDLPRPTTYSLGLDDHVDGGHDLFLNGAGRKVRARHQDHRFQPADRVMRTVGVDRAHRTFVTGVHGLQHVQGLAASTFAHHDPVRPHPEGVANEVPDLDCTFALDVGRPGFQANHVRLPQLKLRCIFEEEHHVGGCGPHLQQVRGAQLFPRELPNRHAWTFESERRQYHIDAG